MFFSVCMYVCVRVCIAASRGHWTKTKQKWWKCTQTTTMYLILTQFSKIEKRMKSLESRQSYSLSQLLTVKYFKGSKLLWNIIGSKTNRFFRYKTSYACVFFCIFFMKQFFSLNFCVHLCFVGCLLFTVKRSLQTS